MIEHPEHTIYDPPGDVYYVPFVTDQQVGYRVSKTDGSQETFIYLHPSSDSSGSSTPDVFVYEGIENDPAEDGSICFVVPEHLLEDS